jgi:integrase
MKGCRPFTEEEVKLVLESLSGKMAARNRALFLLGVRAGFRISEMLSLRLGSVLQFGRIVERVWVDRRSMKGKIEGRTQVLHAAVRQALVEWIEQMAQRRILRTETPLFLSQRNPDRAISRFWAYRFLKKAFRACEMQGKLATHSMRKTFAARAYEGFKGDRGKIQIALGHKSGSSTDYYLSFRQEDIDGVILAMGAPQN